MHRFLALLATLPLVLQGGQAMAPAGAATAAKSSSFVMTVDEQRPATVVLPNGSTPAKPRPLVLVLHGFGSSGAAFDRYLQMRGYAAKRDVVLAFPNGTQEEKSGDRFWNATDDCCDYFGANPDDSAYLASLVDEIAQATPIDRTRVYVFGHSNGGFMAYRLACDHADTFAAIAALAGATYLDPSACSPSQPVSVLSINGTKDYVVSIQGGDASDPYPSVADSLAYWSGYDGCSTAAGMRRTGTLDLDRTVKGRETTSFSYTCPSGISIDYWSMAGVGHSPALSATFSPSVLDWLLRHRLRAAPAATDTVTATATDSATAN